MAYYLIARHAAQGKDLDAFLRMMADAYKMLLSRVVRMRMSVDFPTRFGPSGNYSRCGLGDHPQSRDPFEMYASPSRTLTVSALII